jgi:hypothetical protein
MWKKWLKWCGKAIVTYAPKIAEIVVDLLTKKKPEPSA